VDVQAPVHHEAHRVDHVQQPLDGYDAGDVHQLPQVLVRALLLDLLDGGQARGVGGVELLGDDAVGDDDGSPRRAAAADNSLVIRIEIAQAAVGDQRPRAHLIPRS